LKLYNTKRGIIIHYNDQFFRSTETCWDKYVNTPCLYKKINSEIEDLAADAGLADAIYEDVLTPIGSQEV
jgi:hypothetical protein